MAALAVQNGNRTLFSIIQLELCAFTGTKDVYEWYFHMLGINNLALLSRELYGRVGSIFYIEKRISTFRALKEELEKEIGDWCDFALSWMSPDEAANEWMYAPYPAECVEAVKDVEECMRKLADRRGPVRKEVVRIFRCGGRYPYVSARDAGGTRKTLEQYVEAVLDEGRLRENFDTLSVPPPSPPRTLES